MKCAVKGCANWTFIKTKLCIGHRIDQTAIAQQILDDVCRKRGLRRHQIAGVRIVPEYVRAREVFVRRCRSETALTWEQIGALIGRSHSGTIDIWQRSGGRQ